MIIKLIFSTLTIYYTQWRKRNFFRLFMWESNNVVTKILCSTMKWKTVHNIILCKLKFNSFEIYKLIMNLELTSHLFLYLMNRYKYDIILHDKRSLKFLLYVIIYTSIEQLTRFARLIKPITDSRLGHWNQSSALHKVDRLTGISI